MEHEQFVSVINSAIEREIESAELYTGLSKRASKSGVEIFFKELAGEERKHKELLEKILNEEKVELKLKDVPDLKISDYVTEQEYSDEMSYQDALIMAMNNEENARDLYNFLAETTLDPELQKVFMFLAQQEAGHKLKLEEEYDDVILAED